MFVWPLITTMEDDNCIWCHSVVRPRQEAIECDVCSKWQHRKCGNIGITRAAYRQMVKDRQVINWTCSECQQPNLPEEPMQTEEEDDSIHASFNVELPFDIPSDVEEENIADDSVYDDDEDVPAGPVINDKAVECNKPFYELLELLHTETTKVPL
ncbi:uncharacterized protein [Mytilus edulis]|uniref:uncharacterized protein n=1 Tax=Mytilus edulis TaxID=6550 RepID=UPI0039EF37B1